MCLALPAEVIALEGADRARVSLGGVEKVISVALVDGLEPGDFVVVHVGYALTKIDEAEAKRTLELLARTGELAEQHQEILEGTAV